MKKRVKSIDDQYAQLHKHFPNLTLIYNKKDLPKAKRDASFISPKCYKVNISYGGALEIALGLLAKSGIDLENNLPADLEEIELGLRTRLYLEEKSKGDYFLISIQTEDLHLGKSVKKATEDFSENEFSLGPYEVAIFLYLNPDWLDEQTGIYCSGGVYRSKSEDVICFFKKDGVLSLENRWANCPNSKFSMMTDFLE